MNAEKIKLFIALREERSRLEIGVSMRREANRLETD